MENIGKRVGGDLYIHKSAVQSLSADDAATVKHGLSLIKKNKPRWNVARLSNDNIAFLNYPNFDEEPFPQLQNSIRVDLFEDRVSERSYKKAANPPILHRKELLVADDYPKRSQFCDLTERLEELGLFYDVHKIGFLQQWTDRLKQHEIELSGHEVVAWADTDLKTVYRHRTAMIRYQLSQPVQLLMRYSLLEDGKTFFDYGCGRGDDVATLRTGDIKADGWDPHFAKGNKKVSADVINIGFVLNVIEDLKERNEALSGAWKLTKSVLSVGVMSPNAASIKNTKPYNDGFLTSRGTFQKYYPQEELKDYITRITSEEPIAVAPGIFFVFKDKLVEQEFLLRRYERDAHQVVELRSKRKRQEKPSKIQKETLRLEALQPYLEELAEELFQRGRPLHQSEVPVEIRDVLKLNRLPLKKAEQYCLDEMLEPSDMEEAVERRKNDLRVYLALEAFSQRKAYRELPRRLQMDLKVFWGSYGNAHIDARNLLFSVGDTEKLRNACEQISEDGLGYILEGEQLQFHSSVMGRLPAILRCYVGCAGVLYGDLESADLIKIHINTGKLTLQTFDNFLDPLPEIRRRVKIDMRAQRVRVFDYRGNGRSYLFMKSLFIPEDFDNFREQSSFDQKVRKIEKFDFSNYGPDADVFDAYLSDSKLKISNFELTSV